MGSRSPNGSRWTPGDHVSGRVRETLLSGSEPNQVVNPIGSVNQRAREFGAEKRRSAPLRNRLPRRPSSSAADPRLPRRVSATAGEHLRYRSAHRRVDHPFP